MDTQHLLSTKPTPESTFIQPSPATIPHLHSDSLSSTTTVLLERLITDTDTIAALNTTNDSTSLTTLLDSHPSNPPIEPHQPRHKPISTPFTPLRPTHPNNQSLKRHQLSNTPNSQISPTTHTLPHTEVKRPFQRNQTSQPDTDFPWDLDSSSSAPNPPIHQDSPHSVHNSLASTLSPSLLTSTIDFPSDFNQSPPKSPILPSFQPVPVHHPAKAFNPINITPPRHAIARQQTIPPILQPVIPFQSSPPSSNSTQSNSSRSDLQPAQLVSTQSSTQASNLSNPSRSASPPISSHPINPPFNPLIPLSAKALAAKKLAQDQMMQKQCFLLFSHTLAQCFASATERQAVAFEQSMTRRQQHIEQILPNSGQTQLSPSALPSLLQSSRSSSSGQSRSDQNPPQRVKSTPQLDSLSLRVSCALQHWAALAQPIVHTQRTEIEKEKIVEEAQARLQEKDDQIRQNYLPLSDIRVEFEEIHLQHYNEVEELKATIEATNQSLDDAHNVISNLQNINDQHVKARKELQREVEQLRAQMMAYKVLSEKQQVHISSTSQPPAIQTRSFNTSANSTHSRNNKSFNATQKLGNHGVVNISTILPNPTVGSFLCDIEETYLPTNTELYYNQLNELEQEYNSVSQIDPEIISHELETTNLNTNSSQTLSSVLNRSFTESRHFPPFQPQAQPHHQRNHQRNHQQHVQDDSVHSISPTLHPTDPHNHKHNQIHQSSPKPPHHLTSHDISIDIDEELVNVARVGRSPTKINFPLRQSRTDTNHHHHHQLSDSNNHNQSESAITNTQLNTSTSSISSKPLPFPTTVSTTPTRTSSSSRHGEQTNQITSDLQTTSLLYDLDDQNEATNRSNIHNHTPNTNRTDNSHHHQFNATSPQPPRGRAPHLLNEQEDSGGNAHFNQQQLNPSQTQRKQHNQNQTQIAQTTTTSSPPPSIPSSCSSPTASPHEPNPRQPPRPRAVSPVKQWIDQQQEVDLVRKAEYQRQRQSPPSPLRTIALRSQMGWQTEQQPPSSQQYQQHPQSHSQQPQPHQQQRHQSPFASHRNYLPNNHHSPQQPPSSPRTSSPSPQHCHPIREASPTRRSEEAYFAFIQKQQQARAKKMEQSAQNHIDFRLAKAKEAALNATLDVQHVFLPPGKGNGHGTQSCRNADSPPSQSHQTNSIQSSSNHPSTPHPPTRISLPHSRSYHNGHTSGPVRTPVSPTRIGSPLRANTNATYPVHATPSSPLRPASPLRSSSPLRSTSPSPLHPRTPLNDKDTSSKHRELQAQLSTPLSHSPFVPTNPAFPNQSKLTPSQSSQQQPHPQRRVNLSPSIASSIPLRKHQDVLKQEKELANQRARRSITFDQYLQNKGVAPSSNMITNQPPISTPTPNSHGANSSSTLTNNSMNRAASQSPHHQFQDQLSHSHDDFDLQHHDHDDMSDLDYNALHNISQNLSHRLTSVPHQNQHTLPLGDQNGSNTLETDFIVNTDFGKDFTHTFGADHRQGYIDTQVRLNTSSQSNRSNRSNPPQTPSRRVQQLNELSTLMHSQPSDATQSYHPQSTLSSSSFHSLNQSQSQHQVTQPLHPSSHHQQPQSEQEPSHLFTPQKLPQHALPSTQLTNHDPPQSHPRLPSRGQTPTAAELDAELKDLEHFFTPQKISLPPISTFTPREFKPIPPIQISPSAFKRIAPFNATGGR